jgi:tRNA A-37 threonylcarbamoyl transferase component Bud32
MTLRVKIEHGQDAGKTWRLAEAGDYTIGRQPGVSIRVIDMKVSKEHCRLRVVAGNGGARTVLGDLGSTHGTLVNGQPVSREREQELKPGDEIRLGVTILRVLSDGPADAVASPAAPTPPPNPDAAPSSDLAATTPDGPSPRKRSFAPDDLVGKEVAGYRVIEKIGQGGMGAVYRAEQLSLHREVALKVLSEKFVSDAAFVDQFLNEARAAGALNHPNVVQVYDVGQHEGRYYFSMEFVTGGSIEDRLKDGQPADWREALNWFLDAANALIYAQKRGILHRDVKPDNLMVADNGSAKLCDLGLAKRSESSDLMSQGIIGTPHFISPEAIRRKKEIDGRSDLYSLGCTFFRILTGQNPYTGAAVKDILMAHLKDPVPRISARNPEVPKDLDEVVFRLMQKEPDQRYASAEELFQALDRIRIQFGLEAHGIRPTSRRVLALAGVLLLVAAGAVAYLLTRPKEVVERTKTPEEIAAEAEQARLAAESEANLFKAFFQEQNTALKDLELRESQAQGTEQTDDFWLGLAGLYETFGSGLRAHATYGTRDEITELAARAESKGEDLRGFVEVRRTVQKELDAGRAKGYAELEEALRKIRGAYDEAFAAGNWSAAEAAIAPEKIAGILDPIRGRKQIAVLPTSIPPETRKQFADLPLLDAAKVAEAVTQSLGEPPGKALHEVIGKAVEEAHRTTVKVMEDEAAKQTPEGYAEAVRRAEAYLPTLPDPLEAAPEGTVAHQRRLYVSEVRRLRDGWLEEARALESRLSLSDRRAYWELLRTLHRPGTGLFVRFEFGPARVRLERAATEMQTSAHRDLVLELLEDARALEALIGHSKATFESGGWASDKVEIPDGEKTRSARVKEVTAIGLVAPDPIPWADLGPEWAVTCLVRSGPDQARFALEPSDHRALAVLSLIARRFDLAASHYQAYRGTLGAESARSMAEVMRRLARLPQEEECATAFYTAATLQQQVAAFIDSLEAQEREGKFDRAAREAAVAEGRRMRKVLESAQEWLQRFEDDPRFPSTTWGSALRHEFPEAARYAP